VPSDCTFIFRRLTRVLQRVFGLFRNRLVSQFGGEPPAIGTPVAIYSPNMERHCPRCHKTLNSNKNNLRLVRAGSYYRTSDRREILRYRCGSCKKGFSEATHRPTCGQKKRHLNKKIMEYLASSMSQRRIAILLRCHRTTIARKLKFLAEQAKIKNDLERLTLAPIQRMVFDDLETIEHTKLKPLSVTLAVQKGTRRILGFVVSQMPAKGIVAATAKEKYGPRPDCRRTGRDQLFSRLKPIVDPNAVIESDECPHYPSSVRKHFPNATHVRYPGRRGREHGHGEMKVGGFDPLFSVNHTAAMLRANISRLVRKTWVTTKRASALSDHIEIYVRYHNSSLLS
jgi:transposase-like protein